jgi:hypothetical protein
MAKSGRDKTIGQQWRVYERNVVEAGFLNTFPPDVRYQVGQILYLAADGYFTKLKTARPIEVHDTFTEDLPATDCGGERGWHWEIEGDVDGEVPALVTGSLSAQAKTDKSGAGLLRVPQRQRVAAKEPFEVLSEFQRRILDGEGGLVRAAVVTGVATAPQGGIAAIVTDGSQKVNLRATTALGKAAKALLAAHSLPPIDEASLQVAAGGGGSTWTSKTIPAGDTPQLEDVWQVSPRLINLLTPRDKKFVYREMAGPKKEGLLGLWSTRTSIGSQDLAGALSPEERKSLETALNTSGEELQSLAAKTFTYDQKQATALRDELEKIPLEDWFEHVDSAHPPLLVVPLKPPGPPRWPGLVVTGLGLAMGAAAAVRRWAKNRPVETEH